MGTYHSQYLGFYTVRDANEAKLSYERYLAKEPSDAEALAELEEVNMVITKIEIAEQEELKMVRQGEEVEVACSLITPVCFILPQPKLMYSIDILTPIAFESGLVAFCLESCFANEKLCFAIGLLCFENEKLCFTIGMLCFAIGMLCFGAESCVLELCFGTEPRAVFWN